VAVESPFAMRLSRPLDMAADLGDHGGAECEVRDEMAIPRGGGKPVSRGYFSMLNVSSIHDIDMEPVGTLADGPPTFLAEIGEVGREDGRRNDRRRCHCVRTELFPRGLGYFSSRMNVNGEPSWCFCRCRRFEASKELPSIHGKRRG